MIICEHGRLRKSHRSLSTMPVSHPGINRRFKLLRKELGITQSDIALALGTTSSTIKQIERGVVVPNIFLIKNVKRKYHKSYEWILEGS